jgi:hypothetical protein
MEQQLAATGVSTLLVQDMIQHVLDPRACCAPLRVAITHQQGTHCGIWITTPTPVLISVLLQHRRQALLRCFVVSDGPSLTRRVRSSQPASRQSGCHVPVQLLGCFLAAPAANHGFHHLRSYAPVRLHERSCSVFTERYESLRPRSSAS